jgi:hypothetical protein
MWCEQALHAFAGEIQRTQGEFAGKIERRICDDPFRPRERFIVQEIDRSLTVAIIENVRSDDVPARELDDDLRHKPLRTGGLPCALNPLDTQ